MKIGSTTFLWVGLAALGPFLNMTSSEALAQQNPTTQTQQPAVDDVGSSTVPEWEVGPILINPRLVVTEVYDDNIFATRNDKVDDFITIASPAVTLSVEKEAFDLTFDAGADIARYASRQREDYNDYWVNADGVVSLDGGTDIFAGANYAYDHEDRDSPDDVNGREPTTFRRVTAIFGGLQRFDALSLRLGGTFDRFDFDDTPAQSGEINNDDRDRDLYEAGLRASYKVAPGYEPFIQGALDGRNYDDRDDDFGFDRDSIGFNAAAGLKFDIDRNLGGEVLAGYLQQDYDDSNLDTTRTFDFGARVNWRPGPGTTVAFKLDRSLEETTLPGASGYLSSSARLSIDRHLRPDLILGANLGYTNNDYKDTERKDNLISAGSDLRYFFTPNLFLGGGYTFVHRDSNVSGEDYYENLFMVRLGAQLQPGYPRGAFQASDSAVPAPTLGGFYAGAQAGHGLLATALDGSRGAGGSLTADFGADGVTNGGFAGFDVGFGRWRLGLELEAETSNAEWDHARSPGGRVFSVDKNESFGGAFRGGYLLDSGALVYGRAGAVGTQFDTDYAVGGSTFNETDTVLGFRFGSGVEIPLYGGLFWRLDATYTSYADYDIELPGGDENFANSETLVRVGLGYRFGAAESKESTDQKESGHDFSGAYGGLQIGYGGLFTDNEGPRQGGSELEADRAGHGGTGGGFAGYGHTLLGALYVGGELELEGSYTSWDVERDPTGRVYSVEKDWSYGGAIRLGYVHKDIALFYGRVGLVRTSFDTEYEFQNVEVDQQDSQTGLRFGGGIEVAASENIFLRFDYTYTDYDAYRVDYGAGVDKFDNSENLFRLGVGYRF